MYALVRSVPIGRTTDDAPSTITPECRLRAEGASIHVATRERAGAARR